MSSKTENELTEQILVAWYGDDFTGAAAVMEVLHFAGLPAMLFLEVPTRAQLDRFPGLRGIGVASTARAKSPNWMDTVLPEVFESLAALNPALVHYKVCSTLDSSPEVGSIGRAIEIGSKVFQTSAVPALVSAPQMRRYQCFGHLFAGFGDKVMRLDQHPVMACHPVTPMMVSDVALHISKQSDRIDPYLLSLEDLAAGEAGIADVQSEKTGRTSLVSIDCVDAKSEAAAGRVIWKARHDCPFVVGSQGVEYALVRHWQNAGLIDERQAPDSIGSGGRMMSVSGSVSPSTAEQIAWSKQNGFASIAFDATQVCGGQISVEREISRAVERSLKAISQGLDPLVHTAEGPGDPAVAQFRQAVAGSTLDMQAANQIIGESLGKILKTVLEQSGISRAVVSGGDTSGFATQQLGIFALSTLAPTIPGASIFRAHSDGPMDGLQLALKGGQMGSPDYFGWVRSGGGAR